MLLQGPQTVLVLGAIWSVLLGMLVVAGWRWRSQTLQAEKRTGADRERLLMDLLEQAHKATDGEVWDPKP